MSELSAPTPLIPKKETSTPPGGGSTGRFRCLLGLSLLSAGLLYLAYFPVAIGMMAWIALVPLLALVRFQPRPRWMYLAAYLGGLAFYLPVLQWARVADPRMYATWIVLSLYCAVYVPVAVAATRRLERRFGLPLTVAFPCVWVTCEFVRWGMLGSFVGLMTGSHHHDVPGGFSWYLLGHSQHTWVAIIQVTDLGGAYAVSFLVAAGNALVFEWLYSVPRIRQGLYGAEPTPQPVHRLTVQTLLTALLLVGAWGYGWYRLSEQETREGPLVAFLQCNVDQRIRNVAHEGADEARKEARQRVADHFADLARQAARYQPDLIVTAETAYPGYWEEFAQGKPTRNSRDLARRISSRWKTPMLLGMNAAILGEDGKVRSHNSAILLDRDGVWSGRYDKVHRVPFGEYVPLRQALPFLNYLAPYDYDYAVAPGSEFTRFEIKSADGEAFRFGVMICYEDTDPAMARPYARPPAVDFLVNISNDGWFDGTSEHDQHLAICQFRAVETRRAVGRAVNMGISAVVDSCGRVLAPEQVDEVDTIPVWSVDHQSGSLPLADWNRYKKIAGVLLARVPVDSRVSPYSRCGDGFALACTSLVILGLLTRLRQQGKGAMA
ncbi:MAG: apolipoprotein N-acyltransferase [Gemmataceae bacterium]